MTSTTTKMQVVDTRRHAFLLFGDLKRSSINRAELHGHQQLRVDDRNSNTCSEWDFRSTMR